MKLISLILLCPQQIIGLPATQRLVKVEDGAIVNGSITWRVLVRGPRVLFVSPKGYINGQPAGTWNAKGETVNIELPRNQVTLYWQGDEAGNVERWPEDKAK